MGLTFIEGTVTGQTGKNRTIEFLIDSGASYSLLPHDVWQEIGLHPSREVQVTLADGSKVTRKVGECGITMAGQTGHTPVFLGEPGDDGPLLGVITLENLGFVLDPFRRELRVMQLRLG